MGIQINGNNDIISALDGSWTAEGASINTSGILTATTFKGNIVGTAATFTGPVTIGGTLTYEDVTNIDSVGILTARAGIIDSTLTSGRVTYAGVGGRLTDSANLTFSGSDLTVGGKISCDVNSDIHMDAYAAGQLIVGGNGYTSAIALNGDAMHIYHNSSSRGLVLGTNETERLRISGTGKVGIGTNNPDTEFHVYDKDSLLVSLFESETHDSRLRIKAPSTKFSQLEFADSDADTGEIRYDHTDDSMIFYVNNNVERIRITSAGLVQIDTPGVNSGTNGVDAKLQVDSSSQYDGLLLGSAATYGTISRGANNGALVYTGNASPANLGGGDPVTHEWWSGTGGGGGPHKRMVMTAGGKIGIGEAAPTNMLHVKAGDTGVSSFDARYHITVENNGESYLGFYAPDNSFAGVRFHDTTGTEGYIDYYFNTDEMHYYSSAIHKWTANGSERLRIDSAGRLLIAKGTANSTTSQIQIGDPTSGYTWDVGDTPQVLIAGVNNESPTSGTLNIALRVADENNNNMFQIHNRGGGNSDVGQVYVAGNLGIARTNPQYKLHIHTAPTNSTQVTGLSIANDGSSSGVGAKINLGAVNGYDSTTAGISGWYDGTGTSLSLFTTASFASTGHVERLRIDNVGNVGIARTINSYQLDTGGTPSTTGTGTEYDLSINRECFNSTNAAFLGFNKTLNVDNQYAVSTFRSTNTNRNSTSGWMDIAKFVAWDIDAKVVIQAGGTFTGDQVEVRVISSYNSALNNGRSGPYLEVKSTQAHTGDRFTKVRIGCDNNNRHPILQVYFDGSKTHNALGTINVTCHDYGSNYGGYADRGEARFQSGTTLNETWKELLIVDGTLLHGYSISHKNNIVLDSDSSAVRINAPEANGGSTVLDRQALIGTKHIYTAYHNFSSTNSGLNVSSKIKTNSCGELWVIGGWANGNGLRMKKYTWVASGDTAITEQSNTFASRYGVGITINTPTMSISGDYVNFNFTFSDNQGSKLEKLKIHFEYFHQFKVDS